MIDSSKSIVERHISEDKLQENIRELERVAKKVNRLHFIRLLYKDYSVKEACDILGLPSRTGYNWLEKWNKEGINGLNHKKGAGRPSFLTEEQIKELDKFISNTESLSTQDVHKYIKDNFNVDYSLKQVRKIINKLNYS
ncbi:MAG: helix-turn-helix domain-containing protein [Methanobacteriaceae archaeon]|jgi:putative transposase|nr:helix-turn-helix domain-containing protein [Methanobacteriaceae archaeon]